MLLPVPPDRRAARFTQLYVGLVIYGLSSSLLVLGGYGLVPWDVLHQGLERQTGIPIGTWSILVGLVVLLLWIPLRSVPGAGRSATRSSSAARSTSSCGSCRTCTARRSRVACCVVGVLLAGVATGMYIGAGLGPGPRDGLMTGFARRSGWSLRARAHLIEAAVLAPRLAARRDGGCRHVRLPGDDRPAGARLRAALRARPRAGTPALAAPD